MTDDGSRELTYLRRAVIACCIFNPAVAPVLVAHGQLEPREFGSGPLFVFARAIVAMAKANRPIDPLTLLAFLREHNIMHRDGVDLNVLLWELNDEVPVDNIERCIGWVEALRRLALSFDDPMRSQNAGQIDEGKRRLTLSAQAPLRYPIACLDKIRGPWMPGEVDILAGTTGGGKTTLLTTLTREWIAAGRKVLYAGFEMPASSLRLIWAASAAGYRPGDILGGDYLEWPNVTTVAANVNSAMEAQHAMLDRLRCTDLPFVDVRAMAKLLDEAVAWGADVVVIDHLDHVQGAGDLYTQSRQVMATILDRARQTGVRVLGATQLNNEGKRDDPFRQYRPVKEDWVKMGAHKQEVATFMFGLARILRRDATTEELKAVRERREPIKSIEAPFTAQANCIKHRWHGDRIGDIALLRWQRGQFVDYYDTPVTEHPPKERHLKLASGDPV